MFSHFSSAWAKTLNSASLVGITFTPSLFRRYSREQTVRLAPVALGVVISFASDASYSLNDVRETLPGYLALLLHILSTGVSEYFRSILVTSVGPKYLSVCCTVGAAAFSLIVYTAREILVGT
jgi:zinc transporter 5/7